MDTLPIQDLVDAAKARAIDLTTNAVIAQIAALTGPLSGFVGWLFNTFGKPIIRWIVTQAIDFVDRGLFNLNMNIVVSDQGDDYRKAEANVERAKLDPTVSVDEWERLENEANHAFTQLWNFTK